MLMISSASTTVQVALCPDLPRHRESLSPDQHQMTNIAELLNYDFCMCRHTVLSLPGLSRLVKKIVSIILTNRVFPIETIKSKKASRPAQCPGEFSCT